MKETAAPHPVGNRPDPVTMVQVLARAKARRFPVLLVGDAGDIDRAEDIRRRILRDLARDHQNEWTLQMYDIVRNVKEASYFVSQRNTTIESLRWPSVEEMQER
jgi:hypothetical protein